MSAEYDATEFVDSDFQTTQKAGYASAVNVVSGNGNGNAPATAARAPSREEVDSKVGDTQKKLAELKRVQEELERERAGLEETRRRQIEFQTGREEMIQNLTRGVGLLGESEFNSRRDAEQMAKTLIELQTALIKVSATNEQAWTRDNFPVELTRALTVIENARMEWNAARLKFSILTGSPQNEAVASSNKNNPTPNWLAGQSMGQLCKLGLALTWPLAVVALLVGLLMIFTRH